MFDENGNPIEPAPPQDPPVGDEPTDPPEPADPEPANVAPADPAAELVKKENKTQKRIDQITKEKHEARAEAEYWRKVATGEIVPPKQQEITQPVQTGKPQLENFETYEDYTEALTDWKIDQREADKQTKAEQRTIAEKRQTVAEANAARIEAAKETYDDYDDVTANLSSIMVPQVTIEAMQESEVSADLFYYLGKNLAEAKRLQTLSIPAQLREIGKIEAKLEKKPAETKRISKAPTPINPTGANGEVVAKKDPADMTDEEWLTAERNRLAKLGRRY